MPTTIKLLGVATFAIVDVLLLAWLFTRDSAPDADGEQSAGETGQVKVRPPVDESVSLTRGESFTLLRVHPSDCSGETIPKLEISTDQAETFREVGLPVDEDREPAIRSVLAVGAKSADELTLLGTNPDCKKRGFESDDGGESWKRADVSFDWYIAPDRKSITSPSRTSSPNCTPIALDFSDDANAKIVCKSDSLVATSNGGATWTKVGELSGIRTASFVGLGTGVAIAGRKDCESEAFLSEDAGATWTSVACIDEKAEAHALIGGAAKMFATDGNRTWLSEDIGDKWSEVAAQK
ncbi:MAG: hypothetical protein ACRDOT_00465 [Aeromicrobium sp.]